MPKSDCCHCHPRKTGSVRATVHAASPVQEMRLILSASGLSRNIATPIRSARHQRDHLIQSLRWARRHPEDRDAGGRDCSSWSTLATGRQSIAIPPFCRSPGTLL